MGLCFATHLQLTGPWYTVLKAVPDMFLEPGPLSIPYTKYNNYGKCFSPL